MRPREAHGEARAGRTRSKDNKGCEGARYWDQTPSSAAPTHPGVCNTHSVPASAFRRLPSSLSESRAGRGGRGLGRQGIAREQLATRSKG